MIKNIIIVNNNISLRCGLAAMKHKGILPEESVLILLRPLKHDSISTFFHSISISKKNNTLTFKNISVIFEYIKCLKYLKLILHKNDIQNIFLPNNDNLLCNYCFSKAQNGISILTEGLMNYQDISGKNRSNIGIFTKRIVAALCGYTFKVPTTHLSGSFEPKVKSIFTFRKEGMKAPSEKVIEIDIFPKSENFNGKSNTALIVLSGVKDLVHKESYIEICNDYVKFINSMNFDQILVKEHPRCFNDPLLNYLPTYELLPQNQAIEDILPTLNIDCAIGTCCTALITIKIINKRIECYDIGSSIYIPKAYNNDQSVLKLFDSVDVKILETDG